MSKLAVVVFSSVLAIGLSGCGDTTVNKTTSVKRESKIDDNGNEKTKTETKTVETRDVKTDVKPDEPVVKLGPVEVYKK